MRRILSILFCVFLSGCAGLSNQYRASTQGISINYTVKKEQLISPQGKVTISSSDDRLDKEIVGDGAKSNVGTKVLGYVCFGVLYAAVPDQPTFQDKQDPVQVIKTAMTERLSKNGISVVSDEDSKTLVVDLAVREFKLDFNFGKWTGEVGYVAKVKRNGAVVCQDNVYEKATAFNLYGFGSGEKALNEAFGKAVDGLDINSCFSKAQQ